MLTPIIITFRECLEMLLIIIPLIVYLHKINRTDLSKYIYAGSLIGVITSIISGKLLIGQVNNLEGYAQQVFLGAMMIFLAGLILYSIIWVGKQNKNFSLDINKKYNVKLTAFSLLLLSFVTIFRESLEIIMFLLPYAAGFSLTIILGIGIGILASLILAFILFKTTIKLNIIILFSILNLLLILIGGHLFGEGLYSIFPQLGESMSTAGQLIYSLPLLFIFIKRQLRKYSKK